LSITIINIFIESCQRGVKQPVMDNDELHIFSMVRIKRNCTCKCHVCLQQIFSPADLITG